MGSDELLRTSLGDLLDLAHHQVHFAEAKNGALLTLNFALIVGMVAVGGPSIAWQWKIYIFLVSAVLSIAALVSVISFLPRLKPIEDRSLKANGNVAFTGDIAAMGAAVFLGRLAEKLGVQEAPSAYCQDVAAQAYVNARIAAGKFRLFKWAAYLTVGGLIVPSAWIVQQLGCGSLNIWGI